MCNYITFCVNIKGCWYVTDLDNTKQINSMEFFFVLLFSFELMSDDDYLFITMTCFFSSPCCSITHIKKIMMQGNHYWQWKNNYAIKGVVNVFERTGDFSGTLSRCRRKHLRHNFINRIICGKYIELLIYTFMSSIDMESFKTCV